MNPYDNSNLTLVRMMRELDELKDLYGYMIITISNEHCLLADDLFGEISHAPTLEEAIHKAYIKEISNGYGEG